MLVMKREITAQQTMTPCVCFPHLQILKSTLGMFEKAVQLGTLSEELYVELVSVFLTLLCVCKRSHSQLLLSMYGFYLHSHGTVWAFL